MEVNSVGKQYFAALKLPDDVKKHYVYVAKNGDEVCYVGSGVFGRWSHVTSGTSHSYGLNKLHFDGVVLDVQVVSEHGCSKDARDAEMMLIKQLLPVCNIKGNTNTNLEAAQRHTDFLKSYERMVRCVMFRKSVGRRKQYLEMVKPALLYYEPYDVIHGIPMADWGGWLLPNQPKTCSHNCQHGTFCFMQGVH